MTIAVLPVCTAPPAPAVALDPAAVARAHAMQELAVRCDGLAAEAAGALLPGLAPDDAAYLRARAQTFAGVAARLRASPGYQP